MGKVKYIDEERLENKKILLRVDYNVSLNSDSTGVEQISNDQRIKQSIPTIKYLLPNNKIILLSHLGRPQGRDEKLSLKVIIPTLQKYLPDTKITFISDFAKEPKVNFTNQKNGEIILFENLRFYSGEQKNSDDFAKELADFGDVYVNDAFAVSHRADASIVGIPKFLPHFGGLLLKKEIETISSAIQNHKKPFVSIVGGAKVKDKIGLIKRLIEISDYVMVGGGLANPFLAGFGFKLGMTEFETDLINKAKELLKYAKEKNSQLLLPVDVIAADPKDLNKNQEFRISQIPENMVICDMGPETQAQWGKVIDLAKTIIWNGPVGIIENPNFKRGTDFIFYAISNNSDCISIVGGGDTITAISSDEYLNKITHISTGGGAMLEFIEKGTLPGIEALEI